VTFTPRPHVSAALSHLRLSVTVSAATLGACLILQMLVWAFVHFTDVRWTTLATSDEPSRLRVVQGESSALSLADRRARREAVARSSAAAEVKNDDGRDARHTSEARLTDEPANVNRVLSKHDRWLATTSAWARGVGMLAAIVLALAMIQAVVIAGGGSVPGVERAVTAATWAVVIAILCAPLDRIVPGLHFDGALPSYEAVTDATEAVAAGSSQAPGGFEFYARFFFTPLASLVALMIVVLRFHTGVEQGTIATSVSDLDERIAREAASVKLGAVNTPRAVGALNRAMGERPAQAPERSGEKSSEKDARRIGDPSPGEPMRRPI